MPHSIESIASTRKKTREVIRIESLLPLELRSMAAPLVEFLKDYFVHMNEEDQASYEINSISRFRDIDNTDSKYLDLLQKELAASIPRFPAANRVNLYKNLSRYYSMRGSEEAITLFFKILFQDNAEVYYPKKDMLIPSDGSWKSTTVRPVYSPIPQVYIQGNGSGASGQANVVNGGIARIAVTAGGSGYTTANVVITGNGTGATAKATITSGAITHVSITNCGSGYTTASATITGNGSNAILATPVLQNGMIRSVSVVSEGSGYTTAAAYLTETTTGTAAVIWPVITRTGEDTGKIQSYEVVNFGNSYVLPGTFVAYETGLYNQNNGFLSDTIKLQDSYFYQKFSYVIRTGNNLDVWKDTFAKLAHPAGMKFFGEILILLELLNGKSMMPLLQPGYIGLEDLAVIIILQAANNLRAEFTQSKYKALLQVPTGTNTSFMLKFFDDNPMSVYTDMTIEQAETQYLYDDYTIQQTINSEIIINGTQIGATFV